MYRLGMGQTETAERSALAAAVGVIEPGLSLGETELKDLVKALPLLRQAEIAIEQAQNGVDQTVWQLEGGLLEAWFAACTLQRYVEITQQNREIAQLNAERARRAQVTEAEGKKRSVELAADADLYAADQAAKARRITADAEAYATGVIAGAISANGLEAAQFQIAMKQVEAIAQVAQGEGKQTILLPISAMDAFADVFKLLRGKA
jgi:hypothetical protein